MTNDFDKDIDSLLRQTARVGGGESVFNGKNPPALHIDADEISLFAENALPGKKRLHVMEHLANCDRCRKVLSGLILLNAEAESENIHAKEVALTEVSIPWYKKLFMFPQIAYMMGALALVFSGVIALVVMQNARQSNMDSVAQTQRVEEKQQGAKGMSSDGDAPMSEVYSMSNSTTTTTNTSTANVFSNSTSANMTSATPRLASPMSATNSNAAVTMDERQASADKDAAEPKPAMPAAAPPVPNKPAEVEKKGDFVEDAPAASRDAEARSRTQDLARVNKQQAELAQNSVVQNQASVVPDSKNVQRSAPRNADIMKNEARQEEEASSRAKEAKAKTAANAGKGSGGRRTAGGKTFNFRDGAWYDSAYSNQKTINVQRGTDEYKKLDSGLRSIAENIGGVIVIVWKGKGYRIQ